MKRILGLDLGTNSIGWALIEQNIEEKKGRIIDAGSRIIPMSQEIMGEFDKGNSISQTAERTGYRGVRRLRERHLLRRERLHRVLNILGFLPHHYAQQIDFEKNFGKFVKESEPKLVYNERGDFLFKNSFEEMVADFAQHQPQLVMDNKKVPYDWTIYYLRKKALTQKIETEELAWLLLNFNQKRGYYQLRGEDEEENINKLVEFHSLKVVDVTDSGDRKGKDEIWYNVILENGWIYRRTSKTPLDWIGKTKEFIVTTDLADDGSIKKDKEGKEKRSFRSPAEDDWTLVKKKTEFDIEKTEKTVGCYIYDTLLKKPNQKIKGKLVRTIERKFYKEELKIILEKQKEFHAELQDESLYNACIEELYANNESHRSNIRNKDFTHLFINDIIFYQRPLKSKKSLISNCRYEYRTFKDKDGNTKTEFLKCIARSHPLFQEFRLWQFIQNLKIYQKEKEIDGKLQTDSNVTNDFLASEDDWVKLFDWLNNKKEIEQKALLKYFKLKEETHRWNYVEDKTYPCNETRSQIINRLAKVENVPANFLTKEIEESLWHILYSVEDKSDILKALHTFANKNNLGNDFVEQFKKYPRIEKEYGSLSAKAIKKLLPLMRMGNYWTEESIDLKTKERIGKIITGEYDEKIKDRIRDKTMNLTDITTFKGLPLWLACYIVYNQHSEEGDIHKWKTANNIELLQQHSLRNPIVEQVINETLQVVKTIWLSHGNGEENFFNEIHIELGREMKNPADKRKKITNQITENENTNLRIKALLAEMLNDGNVENVRPYSPMQQSILKIYEDDVLNGEENIPEDILKISKAAQPSKSELIKYKLWLEQKYRSPYTGEIIPLNKLFTPAFEIEHIIPQSRYFDDSFSNKIICEAEVNKDKDNSTGYEYIKDNHGKKIELSGGKEVTLFTIEAYEDFVKKHFARNRSKMKKLLMDDIPESFIQRQLNDSRYISKVVKNLLSNIVREEGEQETTSKNVLVSNGSITTVLKQDWGLNDIWNEIITPRFERLNELTNSKNFGDWTNKDGKKIFQTQVPLELQRGFNKKRIDHRHHTLDALIIACASRNHINYLNNEYTKADTKSIRFDLRNKLRRIEEIQIDKIENGQKIKRTISVAKEFLKPWSTFTQEAREALLSTLVSFKKNIRVINKSINWYEKWIKDEAGNLGKEKVKQEEGDNWAIRKPMHKETVSGRVNLKLIKQVQLSAAIKQWRNIVDKEVKAKIKELVAEKYDEKKLLKFFKVLNNTWNEKDISKLDVYYFDANFSASRSDLGETFTSKYIIQSVTDTGIQKILLKHLVKYDETKEAQIIEHPELAFSPDGIDELNKNIVALNNGKFHQPILKVRVYETLGNKFNIGTTGNKKDKFVEAAKGTNLFFAVYQDDNGKRSYDTIPLNIVIERLKQGLQEVPETNEKGDKFLFYLSPNDLVYVPTEEEYENITTIDFKNLTKEQVKRIYKIVSFTGNRLYSIQNMISTSIVDKVEFTQLNKMEFSLDKKSIKEFCWKLEVNRIGKINKITK